MFSHLLVASGAAFIVLCGICAAERSWEYEPKSVTGTSSDEEKLKLSFRVDRVSRGEYAVSGEINWNYDVHDDTMIEALCYRSNTGGNDYKLTPWSIPYQKLDDFLEKFYENLIVKNVGHCSNIPKFGKKYTPPWPKNRYIFDRCVINGDGFPETAPDGFYKVVANITGEVQWVLTFVVKVTTKLF
ncbi:uncharacterized protein LOC115634487 [Scaptodrosophila lebanonensis]|uniref:Uncharacterized protein LOC115634487 n=1 Tax=Drosophila lebanonensis TaxID=7225 RepID=A0A6J2UKW9_DROLE|nr:uncharacterized protein LOC115634487 [Scaptodrosophila lebanonensis]